MMIGDEMKTGEVIEFLGVPRSLGLRLIDREIPHYRDPVRRDMRLVSRMDLIEWCANRPEWHHVLERQLGPLPKGWPSAYGDGAPVR